MTAPNASAPATPPTDPATPGSSATPSSSPTASSTQPRNADGTFAPPADPLSHRLTTDEAQRLGLPTWAAGRTAAEGFQLAAQLYQQQLNSPPSPSGYGPSPSGNPPPGYGPAPYSPPGYQGQPVGPHGGAQPPTQEDWLNDPATAQQRYNEYIYATQIAPQFGTMAQQNAATSLELVRQQEADAFSRWEPEIMQHLSGVDRTLWTPPNIRKIVGMVKADHLDDLLATRMDAEIQRRMAAGALSRPSDSPAGTGQSVDSPLDFNVEELPPERRQMLEATRLVKDGRLAPEFWEFCRNMKSPGQTVEQFAQDWFESAKRSEVLVARTVDSGGNVHFGKGIGGDGQVRLAVEEA